MIKTFVNLFKQKDIRNKIFFTLTMMFIFRLGASIPVPLVDTDALLTGVDNNSILGMMNMLGGGALQNFSIFAMGVGPYINASIVIQLLSMDVIPYLTELTKSGQNGKKQLDKITRYLGVVLGMFQAFTMTYAFDINYGLLENPTVSNLIYVSLVLTAGTMFLLWIADRISVFGIGNGVSMIIFAGIVSRTPFEFSTLFRSLVNFNAGAQMVGGLVSFLIFVLMYVAIIILVIYMQQAERKIPIQYTSSSLKRGTNNITYLPLKINSASVIPVIFASAVMTAPATAFSFFESTQGLYRFFSDVFNFQKPLGLTIYAVLIVIFTFFYTNLQIDPKQISDNLNKQGTYIPGVRPGKETREYVSKVLNRITVLGAIFITFIALLPHVIPMVTSLPSNIAVGGTGIIIVVGVALETMKDLEGQMTRKVYRGFID